MRKLIEADFLPRETDVDLFRSSSIPTSATKEKKRILIVDDDKRTTHLLKVLLEKTGCYLVFEENNSINAHGSARNFRPDLILVDVVMPIRDGGDIAAHVRADSDLQDTPIIFLTALITRAEAKAGAQIDGHSFLAKPIDIQELINAIEGHLPARAKAFGQNSDSLA
jgi:DNA-binding response OmpR family regulator